LAPLLDAAGYIRWDDPDAPNAGGGSQPYFDMGAHEFVVDDDADGISDEWEAEHGLNSGDTLDAHADPDADGQSNRSEYISGTDPNDPSSCLRVISLLRAGDGSGGIEIEWLTVPGKNYTVFYTESISPAQGRRLPYAGPGDSGFHDLTIWKPCSEPMEATGGLLSFLDVGDLTRKPPLDVSGGKGFYRVEVR